MAQKLFPLKLLDECELPASQAELYPQAHHVTQRNSRTRQNRITGLLDRQCNDTLALREESMIASLRLGNLLSEARKQLTIRKYGNMVQLRKLTPFLDMILGFLVEETELVRATILAFNKALDYELVDAKTGSADATESRIRQLREQLLADMSAVRWFTEREVLENLAGTAPSYIQAVCNAIQCVCGLLSLYSEDSDPKDFWRAPEWLATAEEMLQSLSSCELKFIQETEANLPCLAKLVDDCKEHKVIIPEIKTIKKKPSS